ncbi:MAG: DUF2924 domain-containing protein [Gammaproteobacteria bacterium]|nr:DUF2924 domain-containing protein [Gammaproteobacteria bacterium]
MEKGHFPTIHWLSTAQYGRMEGMDVTSNLPDLNTIMEASTPVLRELYIDVFQKPAPKWARVGYLRGNLAWAIQAVQRGHSHATLRRSLLYKVTKQASAATTPSYQPGTRLIREWQGDTYEVTILEKGYLWQGETYRSLSAISHAITGTRWSGPRFFGLKGGAPREEK